MSKKYRAERRNEARDWGKRTINGREYSWNYQWSMGTAKEYKVRHVTHVKRMPGKQYTRRVGGRRVNVRQLGNMPGSVRRRVEAGYAD